jgi:site-specific recombinase XerD
VLVTWTAMCRTRAQSATGSTEQREAKLDEKGPHTLRHTVCSHLAMTGAHAELETTQRYMHLSPRALPKP